MALYTISICTGAGGLDTAVELVCGPVQPLCYLEREIGAAEILAERIRQGQIRDAPIWSDLASFDARGLRGMVDLVMGGLPCQPFSVAGKQMGERDERYIWHDFFRILRECGPTMVLLENVPPFVSGGYFRAIGEELSGLGYRIERPLFLSAAGVGASHIRQRVFLFGRCDELADAQLAERRTESKEHSDPYGWLRSGRGGSQLADTGIPGLEKRGCVGGHTGEECPPVERDGAELAESTGIGWGERMADFSGLPLFAPGPRDPRWPEILAQYPELAPADSRFEQFVHQLRRAGVLPDGVECTAEGVGRALRAACVSKETQRTVHQLAAGLRRKGDVSRTDQLRALGNAVSPPCGAVACSVLLARAGFLHLINRELLADVERLIEVEELV